MSRVNKLIKKIVFVVVVTCFNGCLLASNIGTNKPSIVPLEYYPKIAQEFTMLFPRSHLSKYPVNDLISSRGWTNYLNSYDYNHVYFLQSDIDMFEKYMYDLDDTLKFGNLDFAYMVFSVFKERLADRYEYVQKLLDNGFDFSKDEYWVWKRHDAPWPKDKQAWNDLWRKKIKNEYLASVVSKELQEERSTNNTERIRQHIDATNAYDKVENTATSTNNLDAAEKNLAEKKAPSIEEVILNKYKQYLTVIEDSDSEYVLQKYLTSFAMAYDPHSSYMAPSSYEDFSIEMNLSLVGIGAMLRSEDGMAKIVSIIPGGPADRDKRDIQLVPGDKIIAVAQGDEPPVSILHWPINKAVKLIRGKKGTKVVLTVIPADDPSDTTTKQVDLIRDEVKLEEQAASLKTIVDVDDNGITNTVGLIKIPAFYAPMGSSSDVTKRTVSEDVSKLIKEFLENDNPQGLILDLRNNGGGSLLEAINLTGLFIDKGSVVQVRETYNVSALEDRIPGVAYDGPVIVLVNKLSASASEIFAGALQDYGRALIVGDKKTHGKGTVQTILKMGDKKLGRIKVTTASFYRVSGDSTQLRGVIPDVIMPSYFDYMDLGEETLDNALKWSRINPAHDYLPGTNIIKNMIPTLRNLSQHRIEKDEKFQEFLRQLEYAKEINESVELPLNKVKRKKLSQRENELKEIKKKNLDVDMEDTAFDDEENSDENHKSDDENVILTELIEDPVLKESVYILFDMIEIMNDQGNFNNHKLTNTQVEEQPADDKSSIRNFIEGIVCWIVKMWNWIVYNIFRIGR